MKFNAGMQTKVWRIRPASSKVGKLAEQMKISSVLAQVLINRDLCESSRITSFLSPKLTDLIPPEELTGMFIAVGRIKKAIDNGEKIVIYGDYDVDGITSVSILWHLLQMLRANVDYYIPHRLDEGYGMNAEAVEQLAEGGAAVLITVDCGITAVEETALANKLGVDVIITDHHQPGEMLPEAFSIVHPLLDESYGNPDSAGAMVAFKLAWAVANAYKSGGQLSPQLRQFLLDATTLAGMGTIADVVDLRGENRILAGYGLKALVDSRLMGIRALIQTADLTNADPNSYDVAFKLAPMLNAAGRMGHARLAVELLTTDNEMRAHQIAQYLKDQNRQRQKCQRDIVKQAKQLITKSGLNHPDRKTFVLAEENWHPGVIGIVASRLIDDYYRPTVMLNIEGGIAKGSGRSIEGFNLYAALDACKEHLLSFGGHAMAAGLRLETSKIEAFAEALEQYAHSHISKKEMVANLEIDAETCVTDFSNRVMKELECLEPFGAGNPKPLFATRGVKLIAPPRRCGARNDHLQISIADTSGAVRCIGFGMGSLEKKLLEVDRFNIAFEPQYNTFNGATNLQYMLSDIQFE